MIFLVLITFCRLKKIEISQHYLKTSTSSTRDQPTIWRSMRAQIHSSAICLINLERCSNELVLEEGSCTQIFKKIARGRPSLNRTIRSWPPRNVHGQNVHNTAMVEIRNLPFLSLTQEWILWMSRSNDWQTTSIISNNPLPILLFHQLDYYNNLLKEKK